MTFNKILLIAGILSCSAGALWLIATGISPANMLSYPLAILVFLITAIKLAKRYHV